MKFEDWEVYYIQILKDFGFDRKRDEEAAYLLNSLLRGERVDEEDMSKILFESEVTVVGNSPSLWEEIDRIEGVVISADGATSLLLERGILPAIIVTDLDGRVEDQVKANRRGSIAIVHAHGDNMEAMRRWAPKFPGKVMGTTQSKPFDGIYNFGGFTDGDRGVFLADHFYAKRIKLVGFDFENVSEEGDKERKRRKLDWAYILIRILNNENIVY